MKLKPCRITNCPGCERVYNKYYCQNTGVECQLISNCILKQLLLKPKTRMDYVKNKLAGCYGYSPEQKKIRNEELDWIMKEFCNKLNIEVQENGDWKLVKEFV